MFKILLVFLFWYFIGFFSLSLPKLYILPSILFVFFIGYLLRQNSTDNIEIK